MDEVQIVIVTISDSCYEKTAVDKSGPTLRKLIENNFSNYSILTELIPDDQKKIEELLLFYSEESDKYKVKIILTTGGTGFSPRDVTPEATKAVIEKECPQLTLSMSLESFKKTPFAALSRAVCGIRNKTLIINFPGSPKACEECFIPISKLLPHIIHLMSDKVELTKKVHSELQSETDIGNTPRHICPHKTGLNTDSDRNSSYPMISVDEALNIILKFIRKTDLSDLLQGFKSPINIPPFRASIKDGYAMKSTGLSGVKKVLSSISAGDEIVQNDYLQDDECYKINTGAPLPSGTDCIVQIEDTKLVNRKLSGEENLVEILVDPILNMDVRPIGSDLEIGTALFPVGNDFSPVSIKSILASVGYDFKQSKPKIGILSTGSELLKPNNESTSGSKIYDSNTTMLIELLRYFGFESSLQKVTTDDFQQVKTIFKEMYDKVDIIICSGGVSMGDKDYIKPVLKDLEFTLHFGRVNMKPGKPMTFASKQDKYFFGLPGNPVSAFVTFHLFVLPAIRSAAGWTEKLELSKLIVTLQNDKIELDSRPEYVRASIISKNGNLHAAVTGNQMSSRLQSIVGADVLLHLPSKSETKCFAFAGEKFTASVLRCDFISKYE